MLVKTCETRHRVGEIFHTILEGGRTVDGFLTRPPMTRYPPAVSYM
jgi:hypothetical protein